MDIIAIILSIISFLFSIGVFLSDRIRQKRLDTLNAINTLQEDWLSGLHLYIRKYNRDGKKALEAHLNKEDQDYYDYATNCLINLENFASGVDLGIYDLKVIKNAVALFSVEYMVFYNLFLNESYKLHLMANIMRCIQKWSKS